MKQVKFMEMNRIVIIIGMIIAFFGAIFHLQGQGHIGPESSFMYSNPEWNTNGIIIVIIGGLIVTLGVILRRLNR